MKSDSDDFLKLCAAIEARRCLYVCERTYVALLVS